MTTKNELLKEMFILHWKYDTIPDFDNPTDNSPEAFVLSLYDKLKNDALIEYPWRSAVKYITLTPTEPTSNTDNRYKYVATLPDDFLLSVGFWSDSARLNGCQNEPDNIGKLLKTNQQSITVGYISSTVPEEELEPWVITWIEIYIAVMASDVGGMSEESKQMLVAEMQMQRIKCGNKDYEMSQKDEVSSSIHQFQWY